jgi:uncharacterized BrkB/YihY/UPF0761 family membrane protein
MNVKHLLFTITFCLPILINCKAQTMEQKIQAQESNRIWSPEEKIAVLSSSIISSIIVLYTLKKLFTIIKINKFMLTEYQVWRDLFPLKTYRARRASEMNKLHLAAIIPVLLAIVWCVYYLFSNKTQTSHNCPTTFKK